MDECDAAAEPPKSWRDPTLMVADVLAGGTSGGGGREKCGKLDAAGRRLVKEDCGLSGMESLMVRAGARGPRHVGDGGSRACCFREAGPKKIKRRAWAGRENGKWRST